MPDPAIASPLTPRAPFRVRVNHAAEMCHRGTPLRVAARRCDINPGTLSIHMAAAGLSVRYRCEICAELFTRDGSEKLCQEHAPLSIDWNRLKGCARRVARRTGMPVNAVLRILADILPGDDDA